MINAIIPARGGSKGIPNKNIITLGGHPLIAYSILACQASQNIDRIIISTDCPKIAKISLSYGAEVPFLRPIELATDHSTDVEFLNHFFSNIDCNDVALIRPTTPFRSPCFMDEVVSRYRSIEDDITGLRTVYEVGHNPYKMYQIKDNICYGFFENFKGNPSYTNLPRQTFPKAYVGNGHIDIIKKTTLLSGCAFGDIIYAQLDNKMIDIDDQADLIAAENYLEATDNIILKNWGNK